MEFNRGDRVEVASKEEGYEGSYYSARIVSELSDGGIIVQYKNLLKEDQSGQLVEAVNADEVRPIPPKKRKRRYRLNEYVDAYDNDGWWAGRIVGKVGSEGQYYSVYFDISRVFVVYPLERLRVHQEWSQGEWHNVLRSSNRLPSLMGSVVV